MNINVISCFEVKPRRQRHETGPILDRKAFRLCIDRDDCERLLVDSHWPESVVISSYCDWWNAELDELKEKAILSCRAWQEAGKPRHDPLNDNYRKDELLYLKKR